MSLQPRACASGIVVVGALALVAGCAQVEPSVQSKQLTAIVTQQNHKVFRCQPYLELAAGLQAMPPAEAASQLRAWADSGKYDNQVLILCRMLFVGKDGLPLPKSPYLHLGPILPTTLNYQYWLYYPKKSFAETDEHDWPDWPLAIIDGVPFCIQASTGAAAGSYDPPLPLPLQSPGYLDYCLQEGHWTTQRYEPVDLAAREKALEQLLHSPTWRRDLGRVRTNYLTYQIADQASAIEPEAPATWYGIQ